MDKIVFAGRSVSSSFVKSLMGPLGWHWHVKQFLPLPVYCKLLEYLIRPSVKLRPSGRGDSRSKARQN